MIDKALEAFPLARVLICHFHPKKYLRTEMSKPVYGGRDAVEVNRVEDAVDMMVKAQDETEYDWGLRYMSYLLDGVDEKTFFLYISEDKRRLLAFLNALIYAFQPRSTESYNVFRLFNFVKSNLYRQQ
ncbi:hypothetical protein GQ600_1939 [Phytophthora cactorum]|nr:hypothetical protein GQ600_1939 [Phytophthora cactorum]